MESKGYIVPKNLVEVMQGAWYSEMLNTALDLELFDYLEENGPLPAALVAERLELNPNMTKDLLAGLAAMNILNKDMNENFSNTEETKAYAIKKNPLYIGNHLMFHGGVRDNSFKNLKERITNKIKPVFEQNSKDVFNDAY